MLIHTFNIWIWFLNWCDWWGTGYIGGTSSALSPWGSCRASCRRFLKKSKLHTSEKNFKVLVTLSKFNITCFFSLSTDTAVMHTGERKQTSTQNISYFGKCATTTGKAESQQEIFSSIIQCFHSEFISNILKRCLIISFLSAVCRDYVGYI